MPGRRYPRRPPPVKQSEHARSAFLGALDGRSSLPEPVRERPGDGNNQRVLFVTETFYEDQYGSCDPDLQLTHVPIDGSEIVFLETWEGGGVGYAYMLSPDNWERETGSDVLTIYNCGQTTHVYYAYYDDESEEDDDGFDFDEGAE